MVVPFMAAPSVAVPSAAGSLLGPATVVAHQGGWDEILLVVAPIVVIAVVLAIVKRRVEASVGAADPNGEHDSPNGEHDGGGAARRADGDIRR